MISIFDAISYIDEIDMEFYKIKISQKSTTPKVQSINEQLSLSYTILSITTIYVLLQGLL